MTKQDERIIEWMHKVINVNKDRPNLLGIKPIEDAEYIIECIEKQIPKKPTIEYLPLFKAYCPVCEGRLLPSKWCSKCGQAILWESGNE